MNVISTLPWITEIKQTKRWESSITSLSPGRSCPWFRTFEPVDRCLSTLWTQAFISCRLLWLQLPYPFERQPWHLPNGTTISLKSYLFATDFLKHTATLRDAESDSMYYNGVQITTKHTIVTRLLMTIPLDSVQLWYYHTRCDAQHWN